MTPYQKRILSPITLRMAGDMRVRNLAPRTIDTYTYHVERFAKHFGKPLDVLGPEEIREYQLHLIEVKHASWSSFNQAVCGLRFLYHVTLPRPWVVQHIPFGKRPRRLPSVLGSEEVSRLIACVPHPKHRMLLLTLYAAGLRLTEGTHLQVADIDSTRMQLKVMHGKGAKQRRPTFGRCPPPVTPAAGRAAFLLETDTANDVPVPRQDSRRPLVECHGAEGVQDGGGAGPHQQAGLAAHAASQLRDRTPRSGGRSAGDRSVVGTQEFYDDDDLSACASAPLGFDPQSLGLVAGAAMPTLGRAATGRTWSTTNC